MFKKSLILVLFLLGSLVVGAQQFFIESSLTTAYFKDYKNDSGNPTLDNKYSKPLESGLGAGVIFPISKTRFLWDVGLNYNKYKINTSFVIGNTSTDTQYNLSYLSLKTGPSYTLVKLSRILLQLHGHLSYSHFLQGTNRYLDVLVDLSSEIFDDSLLNYDYGLNTELAITPQTSFYLSYNVKRSLKSIDVNDETYKLYATSFYVGLRFQFKSIKKTEKQQPK